MALKPVVWRTLAVLLQNPWLAHRVTVVESSLQHDVLQAFEQRTVRISLTVREGMVLAMARDPFLRDHRGRHPEPDSHRERREVVQSNASMSLRAVQKDRNAHVGDVSRDNHEQYRLPPVTGPASESWHRSPVRSSRSPSPRTRGVT